MDIRRREPTELIELHKAFLRYAARTSSTRLSAVQGLFGLDIFAKGAAHVTQVLLRNEPMLRIGFDQDGTTWATRNDGKPIRIRQDVLREHISLVTLLTNQVVGLEPLSFDHPVWRIGPSQVVRVQPRGGTPIDLWIDVAEGRLYSANLDLGKRIVSMRPKADAIFSNIGRMHTLWQRDSETELTVRRLTLDGVEHYRAS